MQTVAMAPQQGALITKRMLLLWLWCLKEIQREEMSESYRLKMSDVMGFLKTRDYKLIKDDLRKLNRTQVEWNDYGPETERWGVTTLLGQAEVIRETHGNFLILSLPPKLNTGIRTRRGFSELNLMLAKEVRSTAALNLYRICVAYESNPSHLTFRAPPEVWSPRLTGSPLESQEIGRKGRRSSDEKAAGKKDSRHKFEYKYFKRDTLLPAIKEINQITDIYIDLIEHTEGKKVVEIQFKVFAKAPDQLGVVEDEERDEELVNAAKELGVSPPELKKLVTRHGDAKVRRNVKYTLDQQRREKGSIRDPKRYLNSALTGDYANGLELVVEDAKQEVKKRQSKERAAAEKQDQAIERVRAAFKSHRRSEAERMYSEMDADEKGAIFSKFASEASEPTAKIAKTKGLKAVVVKVEFFDWLAVSTWGPVTDKEILEYAVRTRVVN